MRAFLIVILCLAVFLAGGCSHVASRPGEPEASGEVPAPDASRISKDYGAPVHLADLDDSAIDESSGIAASRKYSDLFWTHNDSGDGPYIYAFDRKGGERGTWRVSGAKSRDWEDIAAGPGPQPGQPYLYVGDIGDNGRDREEIVVYRILEPTVTGEAANWGDSEETGPAEAIRLRYPDGAHDAEALAVHPTTGDLYVITKTMSANKPSGVYKLSAPLNTAIVNTLKKVAEIRMPSIYPSMITGADISPDGRRVILCDYLYAYELSLPETSGGEFDEIWKQDPMIVKLGPRQQGEAVCYRLDGRAIMATSEKRPTPLIEVESKR
ncbi:MAG TPA: hypothetical protein VJT09_08955 [Pyrinomonadaceae bacterium]|nr:hypothetical protein [Pyrinomonadaceae bacterium]